MMKQLIDPVPFELGYRAKSIFGNPYHLEYPLPSKLGKQDETAARHFVDGYVKKLKDGSQT